MQGGCLKKKGVKGKIRFKGRLVIRGFADRNKYDRTETCRKNNRCAIPFVSGK